jgi:hypothetical protein
MAGFINPAIYAIGKGTSYSSSFHDIMTGNNTSSSSPNNYYAVTGYDLCTGWGTPIGQSLINAVVGAPDSLGITPSVGFTANGAIGGPFSPNTLAFVLTNSSSSSLTWSVIDPAAWLEVTPTNGVLAAHAIANVTIDLSTAADKCPRRRHIHDEHDLYELDHPHHTERILQPANWAVARAEWGL